MKKSSRELLLFSFFFFTIIPAYCFQLDDLLTIPFSEIQKDIKGNGFFQCAYPNELISYYKKNTILGFPVSEIILRFSPDKKLKAADIIVAYSRNLEKASTIRETGDKLAQKIQEHFGKNPKIIDYVFPNGAKVSIKRWNQGKRRFYLCSRIADEKYKKFSFIFLRIEPSSIPEKSFIQMLQIKKIPHYYKITEDGGKYLCVPMRSQLPGTSGCWFTSVARQLNYLGSEINSLTFDLVHSRGNKPDKLLNFKRQVIQINKRSTVENSCLQFIRDYNEISQKEKQAVISLLANGNRWNDNMGSAKPDILKKMNFQFINMKQYHFFRSIIKKNIDNDIPVGWFVVRCKRGAHQRLIIGYNSSKDTLYYSDSWSPKTEIKEMPTICVYLMTRLLEIYTPL